MLSVIVLSWLPALIPAQHHAEQTLPPLNKSETSRLIRDAERQLAQFRFQEPRREVLRLNPTGKAIQNGVPVPLRRANVRDVDRILERDENIVDHRGNPLIGRICHLRVRHEFTTKEVDAVQMQQDDSAFQPTAPLSPLDHEDDSLSYVLNCTINASMSRFYTFDTIYPGAWEKHQEIISRQIETLRNFDPGRRRGEAAKAARDSLQDRVKDAKSELGEDLSDHRDEVRALRHQVLIKLPPGIRPPTKMPRYFNAWVKITAVEWDRSALMPTFRMYGNLIESERLNINSSGIIDQSAKR